MTNENANDNADFDEAYWNEDQTRVLKDMGGQDRVVTMPRIYWGSFDFLLEETRMTEQDLLAIGDEEAALREMSFEDYFPEGLACMQHFYLYKRPELLKRNTIDADKLAGYIGPVSKLQIEELEASIRPTDTSDPTG